MGVSAADKEAAAERLAILARADAFQRLIDSPGWKEIYGLHIEWLEKYRSAVRTVNTSNAAVALESLRQWQLAEELIALEVDYINSSMRQAEELRGSMSLMDAVFMERQQNEQQSAGGDPTGADTAGY